MKSYRTAFWTVVVINILLAGAFAFLRWRGRGGRAATESNPASATAASPLAGAPPPDHSQADTGFEAAEETPLAPVQLTPQRLQSIGVKTGVVEVKPVADEIRTVGDVEVDEERLAYVQVRFPGWIQKVFADSTYQYIRKGEPLFTIYSPDVVTTEEEYLLARQSRNLLASSSVPGVAAGGASLLEAATERLRQWEIPEREIAELEATGKVRRELGIDAPVSGYITERNALPNMYVQPETRLYAVADLSVVWVYAQVFQNDVGRIKPGDPATVTVDAYPGRTFSGRVNYVWPQVDMTTRTQRVRLVFSNPSMKLTPGMFVNARLQIPLGRRMTIPASGVLQSGTRQMAFVDHGGGYLEPREIELGPRVGDEFIVQKGLKAGERVVTSANFLIDSESQLQAALGSFLPPPPGAGAATAMNAPGGVPQAALEFTTQPSPPHRGDNTFRVKLTSGNAPLTGAQVTVTFFMPAMPAMGMGAMRVAATLAEKGGGVYEGSGQLQSGGAWQVSIVAQKNGKTIASKAMTVNAEGEM
jgi:RND family efflux transporter MFP subunit